MFGKQIFFKGRVQGVGFRYAVKRIAGGYEVIGWVRNLDDGRVELLAASYEEVELEEFLQAIAESDLRGGIQETTLEEISPPDDLRGFSIR